MSVEEALAVSAGSSSTNTQIPGECRSTTSSARMDRFAPRPAESHDLLTDPVVAAHVDPSLPAGRLLGPGCGNPSPGTVLVLRGYRNVPGFAQFKVPHRGNVSHMWGAMWGATP